MRLIFLSCLLLCTVTASSQDISILNKWKRAVVNLEARSLDTTGYAKFSSDFIGYLDSLHVLYNHKVINDEQRMDSMRRFMKNSPRFNFIFYTATALFVKKGNRRYLVTARHVLHDPIEAGFRVKYGPDSVFDKDFTFSIVYIVPNIEQIVTDTAKYKSKIHVFEEEVSLTTIGGEVDSNSRKKKTLVDSFYFGKNRLSGELGYNSVGIKKECAAYTFSSIELDLAVVSLDNKESLVFDSILYKAGDYLEKLGYKPVEFSDIKDEPSNVGSPIFSVGFPGSISKIARRPLDRRELYHTSIFISEPNFSFGKISLLSKYLNYFWIDASVMPGNSGGPIIENDKLVGIVSKEALESVVGSGNNVNYYSKMPFGLGIKSKFVKELILAQEKKDRCSVNNK